MTDIIFYLTPTFLIGILVGVLLPVDRNTQTTKSDKIIELEAKIEAWNRTYGQSSELPIQLLEKVAKWRTELLILYGKNHKLKNKQ